MVPSSRVWTRVFSSPSSYLLGLAAIATVSAKTFSVVVLGLDWQLIVGIRSALIDIALYLSAAALLGYLESKSQLFKIVTIPVALALALMAFANAGYLVISGEQATPDALQDLWERRKEAEMVLSEQLEDGEARRTLWLGLAAFFALPLGMRLRLWWLARRGYRWGNARARARACAFVGAAAAFFALVLPGASHFEAHKLSRNALIGIVRGTTQGLPPARFQGFQHETSVAKRELQALKRRARPDVVLVVLESVRYDYTSLAGPATRAKTPSLVALAERGWSAPHTRAVLPHTSKSLFSIHCGRMPVMQKDLVEISADVAVQCLPRILDQAGYRTKFIQSAVGTFEQRPRLAHKLGFSEFAAFEDLGGKRLGYVASEDGPLADAALNWLDAAKGTPSFVTLLTSATHHPYRLSRGQIANAQKQRRPYRSKEDAYARLIEAADEMLGEIVQGLERRGRLNDTLIVVVADHGEGFGEHGIKQHDQNYYEEGLRVPFVIAGPGVVPGSRYKGNASLIDVVPTLLGRLRVKPAPGVLDGHELFEAPPKPDAPRFFGCYKPVVCRGFVSGKKKVVVEPHAGDRWYFDLEADPDERQPRVLKGDVEKHVPLLDEAIDSRRIEEWTFRYDRMDRYDPWLCPANRGLCLHPRAGSRRYRR